MRSSAASYKAFTQISDALSSRAASGAGTSAIQQAKFKSLGPAPEAARDDNASDVQT